MVFCHGWNAFPSLCRMTPPAPESVIANAAKVLLAFAGRTATNVGVRIMFRVSQGTSLVHLVTENHQARNVRIPLLI